MAHNLFFLSLDGIRVKLIEARSAEGFWNPPKGSLLFPWGHLRCVQTKSGTAAAFPIYSQWGLPTDRASSQNIHSLLLLLLLQKKKNNQLKFYGSLHSASRFLEHWIWSERTLRLLLVSLLSLIRCWGDIADLQILIRIHMVLIHASWKHIPGVCAAWGSKVVYITKLYR